MTAPSVPSFRRPERFSFILRGRTVILGQLELDEIREGDLRVSGALTRGFFQIQRYTSNQHTVVLGGRWAKHFHYQRLSFEDVERVECALMRLQVEDWFLVVAAEMALTLSASEPARPVTEFLKRLAGKPKGQKKAPNPQRKSTRNFAEFIPA